MKRFQLLIKKFFPYIAIFLAVLALMIFGSNREDSLIKTPIAANFDDSNFTVTADQASESYTVANIADSLSLPSAPRISENYVTINHVYELASTASTASLPVVEKPTIIDTSNLSRGVISYVVKAGDTLDNIDRHGATKDQIRWSNGLKKETLTVGSTIYIPSIPGIVYKVKRGDTIDSIVKKTGSNKEEVIARNDLEDKEIAVDQLLLIPNGTLPEKERPEYVPPRPTYTYTYSYVRDTADRHNRIEIGSYSYWAAEYRKSQTWNPKDPGAFGNCTWFAWYYRHNLGGAYVLPGGAIGNAREWMWKLSGSYYTGHEPAFGAVMQSTSGPWGHVAVVVAVNKGQSITIQEMNYGGKNRVFQSTINWDDALKYNYIYGHK